MVWALGVHSCSYRAADFERLPAACLESHSSGVGGEEQEEIKEEQGLKARTSEACEEASCPVRD